MIDYEGRRWLDVITRVRGSVLPRLLPRALFGGAMGSLAAWAFAEHGTKLSPIAHTMIGVALGLLLVFRTNASYDRYWEGRRLLGGIVIRVRDLVRQSAGGRPARSMWRADAGCATSPAAISVRSHRRSGARTTTARSPRSCQRTFVPGS